MLSSSSSKETIQGALRRAGDALRARIRSEAAARESTTSPPSAPQPSTTVHASRLSRRWRPARRCLVCGGRVRDGRRQHIVEAHERYRHELHRYRNLLRATAPRLAYRPEQSGSPSRGCAWAVRVHSSGEVTHHPVRPEAGAR